MTTLTKNYQHLSLESQDGKAIVQMNRGRANPMGLEMIQELTAVFEEIRRNDQLRGVVLTGQPGFFSAGLDVLEMYANDRAQMETFWRAFVQLKATLVGFDKPLIAAVSGHSPAGGCVLAVCADYRLMADGPFKIGLNEVPVGIIVSHTMFLMYRFWIGERHAYQNLMEGKLLLPSEALEIGLVDEISSADALMQRALAQLDAYLQFDANTWRATKRHLRKDILASIQADLAGSMDAVLDHWFLPSTRARLKAIVARVSGGKR